MAATLPTAVAASQDDAGTGADAPDDWSLAVDVVPGTFAGVLDASSSDRQDWYRVALPAGQGLRATLAPATADYDLVLLSDDGQFLAASMNWGNAVDVAAGVAPAAVRVGILWWDGAGGYSLSLETFDTTSVSVEAPKVESADGPVPGSVVPGGLSRTVTTVVRNDGVAEASATHVALVVQQGSSTRWLCFERIDLAPGAAASVSCAWDTTGQVGDATVHALVHHPLDDDPSDNHASTRSSVLVNGQGSGVDALNVHRGTTLGPLGFAYARTWYDGFGKGAVGYAYLPGALAFAFADAGSDGAIAAAGVFAPYSGAFAAAWVQDGRPDADACAWVVVGTCI